MSTTTHAIQPLRRVEGIVAPLDRADVDTDQIIPKQFLKRVERAGYGQFLFNDWRLHPDGSPRADFVLNQPGYAGAAILAAGGTSAAAPRASTRPGRSPTTASGS